YPDSPGVIIIGSGIASLLLGLELRERFPAVPVRIVTADTDAHAGGHLASWDEGGYPVEHGFHALFTCYRTALDALGRHGVLASFVRAPGHFFVYQRGAVRRMPVGLRALVPPLPRRERRDGRWAYPGLIRTLIGLRAGKPGLVEELDRLDLREAFVRMGAGPALVSSDLLRMYYDFGFSG